MTRARAQASGLAARLAALGAEVIEAPVIRIEPRAVAAGRTSPAYSLMCLTSPNGVELLFEALARRGEDARALAGATVAAIGPGTARELRRHGIRRRRGAGALDRRGAGGGARRRAGRGSPRPGGPRRRGARRAARRAARARRAGGRARALRHRGRVARRGPARAARARHVRDLHLLLHGALLRRTRSAGFPPAPGWPRSGPITSATARERGIEVHLEAARHDMDGLVDALVEDAA